MSAVPFQSFQTLDVTRFRQTLAKLHETVGCGNGRIEVTRRGCTDVCVLISKSELECLEQALEILAASAEFKAMCDQIQQLVAACGGCAGDMPQAVAVVPDAVADRA
jgi:PHD/YefM family antitoxin component YafN of YafNO toxin-antitoxin module